MNKEEKKYNNHTRNQRRMFRIKKQEEKINDLKLLVGNLQSQLDQANKKLDKIKEYIENNSLYEEEYDYDYDENIQHTGTNDEIAKRDILSIIGGE